MKSRFCNSVKTSESQYHSLFGGVEKVKLTMGELRQLDEGLIIDVAPVFNNQITLAIEEMPIAKGELVIIEDNYAVRLTEILKQEPKSKAITPAIEEKQPVVEETTTADLDENDNNDDDDDFDYEAFDIDEDEV